MTPEKRAALERDGWHFGTVQDLLGLTDAEMAEIDATITAEETITVTNVIEMPPSPCGVCGEPMLPEEDVAARVMYYRPGGLPATTMYHTRCTPDDQEMC